MSEYVWKNWIEARYLSPIFIFSLKWAKQQLGLWLFKCEMYDI